MNKESNGKSSESIQEKIVQLQEAFKSACLSSGEPLSYCALLLRSLNRNRYSSKAVELRVKTYILIDQINSLKRGTSFSHNMNTLLTQRQEIIRLLRSELIVNRKAKEVNLKSCCEKLASIRMYTLTLLQNLQGLVNRFKVPKAEYVSDILQRLSQGTDFLRWTALRKYIEFSNTDDPLLLVPLRKFRNLEQAPDFNRKPITSLFTVDEEMKQRLYTADQFLRSEAESSHQTLEMNPSIITEFDYDEIIYDDTRQGYKGLSKSTKTKQKFQLPEIPTRNNMKLREGNDQLSIMLSKIINDSQLEARSREHRVNPFAAKRRAITQSNQYQTDKYQTQITKNQNNRKKYHHRKLKSMDFAEDSHYADKEDDISKLDTIKNQKTPRRVTPSSSHNIAQLSSQIKLRQMLLSRPTLSVPQASKQEQGMSQLSGKIITPFTMMQDQRRQMSSLSGCNSSEIRQSVGRIKQGKRKKKGNIKVTDETATKETIIEEDSYRKEEVPFQSSRLRWFGQYKDNRHNEFSPEIRQKIELIQKMSLVPKSIEKRDLENSRITVSNHYQESQIYRNPIFQVQKGRSPPFQNEKESRRQRRRRSTERSREDENQTGKEQNRKKQKKKDEQKDADKGQKSPQVPTSPQQNIHQPNMQIISQQNMQIIPQQAMETVTIIPQQSTTIISQQATTIVPQQHPPQQQQIQNEPLNQNNQANTEIPTDNINSKVQNQPINANMLQKDQFAQINIRNAEPPKAKQIVRVPQLSFEAIRPTGDSYPPSPTPQPVMSHYLNENNMPQLPQPSNLNLQPDSRLEEVYTQSKLQRERSLIIQKCIFVSKSMEESVLLNQIKQFNKQSLKQVEPYLTTSYFKNRHIMMTSCVFKEEIASYALHYPYLTKNSRFLFILHLEVRQKYSVIAQQLINTFLKYFFCNDPTNKIIFLKHKQLFSEQFGQVLLAQPYYSGEINTPIKGGLLSEKSFLFERKQLKCSKSLEYTNIFSTYFLYVTHSNELTITTPKSKNIYLSSNFLKRIQNSLKKREVKNFLNFSQLSSYLQEENLPEFTKCRLDNEIAFYSQFFQDCLINSRYFVFSKYFYFTIEPPYSYLCQKEDVYYILLTTSVQRRYFILADKIYEQNETIDLYQHFRTHILNRKISQLFMEQNKRGTLVACPQFQKRAEVEFANINGTGIVNFSLNWRQYIKGVRYFPEEQIKIELIGPFFCGLVQLDESNSITQVYSTIIEEADLQL